MVADVVVRERRRPAEPRRAREGCAYRRSETRRAAPDRGRSFIIETR